MTRAFSVGLLSCFFVSLFKDHQTTFCENKIQQSPSFAPLTVILQYYFTTAYLHTDNTAAPFAFYQQTVG